MYIPKLPHAMIRNDCTDVAVWFLCPDGFSYNVLFQCQHPFVICVCTESDNTVDEFAQANVSILMHLVFERKEKIIVNVQNE